MNEEAYYGKRELNKNETWLINALERLKEVFLKHEKVRKLISDWLSGSIRRHLVSVSSTTSYIILFQVAIVFQKTLGELLFTESVAPCILTVFKQFQALRT